MRPAALFIWLLWLGTTSGWAQAPPGQSPPQPLTWQDVRKRFETRNPTLLADQLNVAESQAQEITAYLRPNPQLIVTVDGPQISPNHGVWKPFAGTFESPAISYLHERAHKRELRLESAKKGTI